MSKKHDDRVRISKAINNESRLSVVISVKPEIKKRNKKKNNSKLQR